ncbi:MAG TPA: STAS domain-containing protein [Pseudonocardiaceae bacterium]|jgi:anti-sigma B factor antagonist
MSQHAEPSAGIDQLISLDTQRVGSSHLVTVGGEVDMVTTPHLRGYLLRQVEQADATLVLDLRRVAFLGSSGLAVLVEILDLTRERDLALRLVCNSREVVRPLEATGLTELFEIYPDPDAALAAS